MTPAIHNGASQGASAASPRSSQGSEAPGMMRRLAVMARAPEWCAGSVPGSRRISVMINAPAISSMAAQAAAYRIRAERVATSSAATRAAASAPCHSECRSVQPSAPANGLPTNAWTKLISPPPGAHPAAGANRPAPSWSRRRAERAPSSSALAEPLKARSSRSPASCFRVHSRGFAGA